MVEGKNRLAFQFNPDFHMHARHSVYICTVPQCMHEHTRMRTLDMGAES